MKDFKNGTIVEVMGGYRCVGQVCGLKDHGFMGQFFDIVILESELFDIGDIQSVTEDLLFELDDYNPGEAK